MSTPRFLRQTIANLQLQAADPGACGFKAVLGDDGGVTLSLQVYMPNDYAFVSQLQCAVY